jgi:hypothetical protein
MAQATTVDQATAAVRVAADEAEGRCSLTCECWDCRSYRRHLVKLAAMVLLACGLGGQIGLQRGLWLANEPAPAAVIELASAAPAGDAAWF